jgi:hypothetical protein
VENLLVGSLGDRRDWRAGVLDAIPYLPVFSAYAPRMHAQGAQSLGNGNSAPGPGWANAVYPLQTESIWSNAAGYYWGSPAYVISN